MIVRDLDIIKRNPSSPCYLNLFEKIFDAFYKNLTISIALVDATRGGIYNANYIYRKNKN